MLRSPKIKPMKHKPKPKTLDAVMQFAKQYTEGGCSRELAARAGVCLAVFFKYLRIGGVKIKKRGGVKGSNPNEPAILSMFDAGTKLQEIGDRFNLTRERIRQIAAKHGRKARGWPKIKLPMEKIAKQYRAMTCDEIAPIYGVSGTTIISRLRERGVAIQRRGRRTK